MIIWRGYGLVALVLCVLGYAGANQLILALTERESLSLSPGWREFLGMATAAMLVLLFNMVLRRWDKPRPVVDDISGLKVAAVVRHDLFFIPLPYLPLVLLGLGVSFLV